MKVSALLCKFPRRKNGIFLYFFEFLLFGLVCLKNGRSNLINKIINLEPGDIFQLRKK